MATIKDWQFEVKGLIDEKLTEIEKAFKTLRHWNFYYKEYFNDISQLSAIINIEKSLRVIDAKYK